MGRQVRKVPKNWEHPRGIGGRFRPLIEGSYEERAAEWDEEARQWEAGFRKSYGAGEPWVAREASDGETYAEYAGERPKPEEYMPSWEDGEADHLMMYEDTSEGTPISPAFATPEELARWLADNGASSFADMTATYEQWLPICKGGWAPSMVIGGGRMMSGVEAMSSAKPAPDAAPGM